MTEEMLQTIIEEVNQKEDLIKLKDALLLVQSIKDINVVYAQIVLEDILLGELGYCIDFDTHGLRKVR